MTATVVWSPNLRLAVKKCKQMKTITSRDISHGQAITAIEEKAIQKQLLQKSKDASGINSFWE